MHIISYELGTSHYFTSLGLSWDAMLKTIYVKLELIIDKDMFQFIEKGMRGRVKLKNTIRRRPQNVLCI